VIRTFIPCRHSAGGGDPVERPGNIRRKNDNAVGIPCSAHAYSRFAQDVHRATAGIHGLQPAAGKKPTCRLSGDQNGCLATSVPVNGCASAADSMFFPSGPVATKASRVPSGDKAK
jgi:hypothetical protein